MVASRSINFTLEVQSASRILLKEYDDDKISSRLAEIKDVLINIKDNIVPQLRDDVDEGHYVDLGLVLFKAATIFGWQMYFSSSDFFDYYYLDSKSSSWSSRVSLVISFLRLADQSSVQLQYSMQLLRTLLYEEFGDFKNSYVVHDVLSLPSLIHNRYHSDKHYECRTNLAFFTPTKFYKNLSKCFLKRALSSTLNRNDSLFLEKIAKVGQSKAFCQIWYNKYLINSRSESNITVFKAIPESVLESFVWALLSNVSKPDCILKKLFSCRMNVKMHSIFIHRIILQKVLTPEMLLCIPFAAPIFTKIVNIWSMESFTTTYDLDRIKCISLYVKMNLEKQPLSVTEIVKGISHFLDSENVAIRSCGMDVATALSNVVDPNNPLSFEDEEKQVEEEASPVVVEEKHTLVVKRHCKKKALDPDEVVFLDSEEEEGEEDAFSEYSSSSEDELEAYDCFDTETSPKVLFLHDCLEILRRPADENKGSNESDIKEALGTIVSNFEKNGDADYFVIPLIRAVLANENVELSMQEKAVVSMATYNPKIAIPFLLSSYALDHETGYEIRINCFKFVRQTIQDISSVVVDNSTGSGRRRPLTVQNRFVRNNVAKDAFRLLINGTVNGIITKFQTDTTSTLDEMLLANALHTLGCIVEYTTGSLDVHSLTEALLPFIWSLFDGDALNVEFAAVVKRQVLFCLSRILKAEKDIMHNGQYAKIINKFIEAMIKASTTDPDVQVRSMCCNLLNYLDEILNCGEN